MRRPHRHPAARQLFLVRVNPLDQPEVEQHHPLLRAREEDVLRLQVPVHHPERVRGLQRRQDPAGQPRRDSDLRRPRLTRDPAGERLPGEPLHHQIGIAVTREPAPVEPRHVRRPDPIQGRSLPLEPLREHRRGHAPHLDHRRRPVLLAHRRPHHGEASGAERLAHREAGHPRRWAAVSLRGGRQGKVGAAVVGARRPEEAPGARSAAEHAIGQGSTQSARTVEAGSRLHGSVRARAPRRIRTPSPRGRRRRSRLPPRRPPCRCRLRR